MLITSSLFQRDSSTSMRDHISTPNRSSLQRELRIIRTRLTFQVSPRSSNRSRGLFPAHEPCWREMSNSQPGKRVTIKQQSFVHENRATEETSSWRGRRRTDVNGRNFERPEIQRAPAAKLEQSTRLTYLTVVFLHGSLFCLPLRPDSSY